MRVVFFGMECPFSYPPLAALLRSDDAEVCAVMIPPPRARGVPASPPIRPLAPPARLTGRLPLPTVSPDRGRSVAGLARAAGVPVLEVARLAAAGTLGLVRALRPDLFVVACFPRLLPPALLRLPRLGALNIHPSLLPAYQGPHPLFWVFHDGLERAGVTVHLMDAGADTGAIVAQAPVALPDGIPYAAAERLCAEEGARLAVGALRLLAAGDATPRPQPTVGVSYAPTPGAGDVVVTPDWSARRAYNFMRGIAGMAGWGQSVRLLVDGRPLAVRSAVAYRDDDDYDGAEGAPPAPAPAGRTGTNVRVRMSPGTLVCAVDVSPRS